MSNKMGSDPWQKPSPLLSYLKTNQTKIGGLASSTWFATCPFLEATQNDDKCTPRYKVLCQSSRVVQANNLVKGIAVAWQLSVPSASCWDLFIPFTRKYHNIICAFWIFAIVSVWKSWRLQSLKFGVEESGWRWARRNEGFGRPKRAAHRECLTPPSKPGWCYAWSGNYGNPQASWKHTKNPKRLPITPIKWSETCQNTGRWFVCNPPWVTFCLGQPSGLSVCQHLHEFLAERKQAKKDQKGWPGWPLAVLAAFCSCSLIVIWSCFRSDFAMEIFLF